jgi:hypothetical protein
VVYGLDHNGDRGKVKGLKNRTIIPFAYDREFIMAGDSVPITCVFSASGYGAEGLRVSYRTHTLPFSPTHPYSHREQRLTHRCTNKQAGEASWLK